LIHIVPSTTYTKRSYRFASQWVANTVIERFAMTRRQELIEFIKSTGDASTASYGNLRGIFFEALAHTILIRGGQFTVRNLNTSVESKLTIPALEEEVTYEFVLHRNKYCRPQIKNFAGVDSWIPGVGLFNMTVNQQHGFKVAELVSLFRKVVLAQQTLNFYWVLPAGNEFNNFTRKSLMGRTVENEDQTCHPRKRPRTNQPQVPKKSKKPITDDDLALCEVAVQYALEIILE